MFPGAQNVVVKHAVGHRAARSLSPERACQAIRQGAAASLRNLSGCKLAVIPAPYRLVIDLNTVAIADQAAMIPVAERVGPRSVGFDADSMLDVLGWINTISALSASLR
jgi:D-amino peptidase